MNDISRESLDIWMKHFDVRAYDACRTFGVEEWAFVLSRRRSLYDMREYRNIDDELERVWRVVIETPLLTVEKEGEGARSVESLNCYSAWCMRDVVESRPELAEVCRTEGDGPPPFVSSHERNSEKWWEELFLKMRSDESEAENKRRSELLFGSYNDILVDGYESNHAYVEIDLSAPDEVILSDFKSWLAAMRQDKRFDHSPVNRFTDKELARWVSNRVLPYIDLMLIARALNTTLTNNFAGGVIFENRDFDPAEKIRKTVAPMARELLSYEMIEALKMAASAIDRKKSTD